LAGGKRSDFTTPHFANRNCAAVLKQPTPYLTLRQKVIDEASGA